ncbi:DNA polymerase-3 subunit delta' [Microbacteriaceae bacterium MWH-Ta3]|nr:DNA polymerase-3 subunit delta' [Microbacteriaceae bacterium MWH-Ta3]
MTSALWDDLIGQDEAVALMRAAAADPDSIAQGWLITGPAGSGRSLLARAFAAELLGVGADPAAIDRQVRHETHPDLSVLATDRVVITIDEVRDLVESSYKSPTVSPWRIILMEDADRMAERTSNVLLKALEEPPPRTIWILCAPSEADVLPTIRSRVRSVRLRVPTVESIAQMLVSRDGVDPVIAEQSARHAQCHIGMARRLAQSPDARERRDASLRAVLAITSVSQAVTTAASVLAIATDDAKAYNETRDDAERAEFLRLMGLEPGATVPPAMRSQIKTLEENQKRRATRALRDGVDRVFTDLESLYRDILVVGLGGNVPLTNRELRTEIEAWVAVHSNDDAIRALEAIDTARGRIERNVTPLLSLEALFIEASGRVAS